MATCPDCGLSSRDDPSLMTLERVFVSKPVGEFSLSGAQMKLSAVESHRLACRCGWSVTGQVVDGYLVAHPD